MTRSERRPTKLKCKCRHTHGPTTNILALSVGLAVSRFLTPALVEGAFVASNSWRLRPFVVPTASRTLSRATSSDGSDAGDEAELPASGSFFNAVPPPKDEPSVAAENAAVDGDAAAAVANDDADMFAQILQQTQLRRTDDDGGRGFARTAPVADPAAPAVIRTASGEKKSFVGIGGPLNDVQNPEYDADGYTLYADEVTGEKKRVFEALVEYPSVFKMKIVGRDDAQESFAPDMVDVVAQSCGVERSMVKHTRRQNGKWTSVTVHAPVKNADMLYTLYENVDKDPRVKFKF